MLLYLLMTLNTLAAPKNCVSFLQKEVTEMERMNGKEVNCKIKVLSESQPEDPSEDCALVVKYSYTCNPGKIKGAGDGCCPE